MKTFCLTPAHYAQTHSGTQAPCGVEGCLEGDPMIGLVQCDACSGLFCLKHRYQPAHHCTAETLAQKEKEDRRTAARLKIEEHLGKRPFEKSSAAVVVKPKKLNPKLELMKMKAKAKGDTSIPQASRMYFSVHFPQSIDRDPVPLYFDKNQSIGRMLDRIAQVGNIPNNNHKLSVDDPKASVSNQ
ncbi:unnamed protein product [Umbelopsis vinacea]